MKEAFIRKKAFSLKFYLIYYYWEGETAMMLTVRSGQFYGLGCLLPPSHDTRDQTQVDKLVKYAPLPTSNCTGPKVSGVHICIEQLYLQFILPYFKIFAVTMQPI